MFHAYSVEIFILWEPRRKKQHKDLKGDHEGLQRAFQGPLDLRRENTLNPLEKNKSARPFYSTVSGALGDLSKIKLIPPLSFKKQIQWQAYVSHLIQLHIFPGVIYARQNIEKNSQSSRV